MIDSEAMYRTHIVDAENSPHLSVRQPPKWRHTFLSILARFPLILFALWALMLMLCDSPMLNFSIGTKAAIPAGTVVDVFTYIYLSGVTFFTLGFGDVIPLNHAGRVVVVGIRPRLRVPAVVIGYMPVLYQAFSKREVQQSLCSMPAPARRLPPPRF